MTESSIKKRLGQFFSGNKVADLLVAICEPTQDAKVLDPMAGDGDMLAAAFRAGVSSEGICGIEIDEAASTICARRISAGRICNGDAFSYDAIACLGKAAWDLVITNPPYVRYQSLSKFEGNGLKLRNAQETREGVLGIVGELSHLSDGDKACFQNIIKVYSGLSDLAVPSWILCAALVKEGGTLAMVVPESWMNREYALSIKYMLRKFFDILYIVEDVNAAWFPEAQVKTNLLVARRVGLRDGIQSAGTESYRRIRLSSNLAGESSLVDGLRVGEATGYHAFSKLLRGEHFGDGFESKCIPVSSFVSSMLAAPSFEKLLKKLEPSAERKCLAAIPNEVIASLQFPKCPFETTRLCDWGIQIGQGLRTGANRFFYTELVASEGDAFDKIRVDSLMDNAIITIAQKRSLPAIRYQNDLGDKHSIKKEMLTHRLLYIQEELFDASGNLRDESDRPLADHIAASDILEFESGGKPTRFRELSAVRTNIRMSGEVRQWYMLPALAKRHLPQLCISRVNYKIVRCVHVCDGIVVDANFSTLWTEPRDMRTVYSVFALMNSTWVQACLESLATVMGGGALKVEAAHLRALPVPVPTGQLLASLQALGERLASDDKKGHSEILNLIDDSIFRLGFGVTEPARYYNSLRAFIADKIAARKR
jgi:hypothetical protein